MCVRLGDGVSKSFWKDNWSGEGPIVSLVTGVSPIDEQNEKVRDYWTGSDWDYERFEAVLPALVRARVQHLICAPIGEKRIGWLGNG